MVKRKSMIKYYVYKISKNKLTPHVLQYELKFLKNIIRELNFNDKVHIYYHSLYKIVFNIDVSYIRKLKLNDLSKKLTYKEKNILILLSKSEEGTKEDIDNDTWMYSSSSSYFSYYDSNEYYDNNDTNKYNDIKSVKYQYKNKLNKINNRYAKSHRSKNM